MFIQRVIDNPEEDDDRPLVLGITVGPEDVAIDPASVTDEGDGTFTVSEYRFPLGWLHEYEDPESGDPAAHVALPEGAEMVRWRTWVDVDLDPACVLNIDVRVAEDAREGTETDQLEYRVPTVREAMRLMPRGYQSDEHRVMATYAAVVGAVSVEDAARAHGHEPEVLVNEARAWALGRKDK